MKVLSLFDGISTGRLALENAGIPVDAYYASEIDEGAIKISEKNWPDIIRLGDVTMLDIEALPTIDLIIGGSPCQGFSRNGNCLNFEDPRSKLFFVFAEILEKLKAKNPDVLFLLENVIMKKEWRDVISDTLGVQPIEINSNLLSAQNRPRQYWTNIEGVKVPEDKGVRLIDILEDVPLETVEKNGVKFATNTGKGISEQQMELVHMVDGEVRINQATKQGYIVAEPGDGVNIQFPTSKTRRGRVVKGKSPTLDTSCEVCIYTGEAIRQYTLTELERLQTLPDGYTEAEGVSEDARRKAIGNGWTTEVITYIFSHIKGSDELQGESYRESLSTNKQNAEYFGTENQMIVLGEELGELSQAAAKWLRLYRQDPTLRDSAEEIREQLVEELADVDIMTEQIRHLLGISEKEFHEKRREKIQKVANAIAKEKRKRAERYWLY